MRRLSYRTTYRRMSLFSAARWPRSRLCSAAEFAGARGDSPTFIVGFAG